MRYWFERLETIYLLKKRNVVQDSCCEISESVEEEFNIGLGKPKSSSPTGWLVEDPDHFRSNSNHVSLLIASHGAPGEAVTQLGWAILQLDPRFELH